MRNSRAIIVAVAFAASCTAAQGEVLTYSLSAGSDYSNNIDRLPDDGHEETVGKARATLRIEETRPWFDLSLWGAGNYSKYFSNTYDDQFLGRGSGVGTVRIIPEMLSWTIEDSYAPILQDQLQAATPDNKRYANLFSTGPDLSFGKGNTQLALQGRYSRTNYQGDTDANTEQKMGDVAVLHRVSTNSVWSIHGGARNVEYQNETFPGYDTYQAYVRLDSTFKDDTFLADLGTSRLKDQGQTFNTPLVRLSASHRFSESFSLTAWAGTQYNDSADRFQRLVSQSQNQTNDIPENVTVLSAPLRDDFAELTGTWRRSRTLFQLSGAYGAERYHSLDSIGKQKSYAYSAEVQRRMTPVLTATLSARTQKQEYTAINRTDKDRSFLGEVEWRVGPDITLGFNAQQENRDSNVHSAEYSAFIFGVEITYAPGRPATSGTLSTR